MKKDIPTPQEIQGLRICKYCGLPIARVTPDTVTPYNGSAGPGLRLKGQNTTPTSESQQTCTKSPNGEHKAYSAIF